MVAYDRGNGEVSGSSPSKTIEIKSPLNGAFFVDLKRFMTGKF
jgi:hypothetical protein